MNEGIEVGRGRLTSRPTSLVEGGGGGDLVSNAAILSKIPAMVPMVCDASKTLRIAAKWSISSHRVARPSNDTHP